MKASTDPTARATTLPMPPLIDALRSWQQDASPATLAAVTAAATGLARHLAVTLVRLHVATPPLAELELVPEADDGAVAEGFEHALHDHADGEAVGTAHVAGDAQSVRAFVHAIEVAIGATRVAARADRAERQLAALDQAVRGIGGVLDPDRVLQLIVDRVRELAAARYAALGIVDAHGTIDRFITSGISEAQRRRIGELPHGHGLLGLIIRENRTYRIPEIAQHPDSYGFPPHHPPMHSFLGTPISSQGRAVGRLYLTDKVGAPEFSEHDEELVEMFARHAAIAIENARLHGQVQRLAIVDERDRISRDLHDSAIQAIYAQTLALDDVPELIDDDPEEARRRVDESVDALHAVIRDIRNFIFGLRPVLLETGSLADGLEHLATELRRNGGVDVAVSVDDAAGLLEELPLEVVAELLAVVREALSNVARHAAATRTTVALTTADDAIRLELADDGRGFRADERPERGHHGLANMRARVDALGGVCEVESAPERGTRIIIVLPRRRGGRSGGRGR